MLSKTPRKERQKTWRQNAMDLLGRPSKRALRAVHSTSASLALHAATNVCSNFKSSGKRNTVTAAIFRPWMKSLGYPRR